MNLVALVQWSIAIATTSLALECVAASLKSAAMSAERCIVLQLYVRSDSKLCQQAREYVEQLAERQGGICIVVKDTLTNRQALDGFWQLARRFNVTNPRVPLFYVYDRLKVGFSDAAKSGPAIEDLFAIHAYVRPTCQHCRDAKRFLNELAGRWKGVRVVLHDVERESGAREQAYSLARQQGIAVASFPVISLCGRVTAGYATDDTSGRRIEELLIKASIEKPPRAAGSSPGRQGATGITRDWISRGGAVEWLMASVATAAALAQVESAGVPPSEVPAADAPGGLGEEAPLALPAELDPAEETYVAPVEAPRGIDLPWIGYVGVSDLGLPVFTFLIGLVDGFNPCAMWVLVFLLSVLVNVKDRRKIAAIAGTFVIVSGLAYFAFMSAWLNVFMFIGIARPLQIALGLLAVFIGAVNVKDFVAFKKGVTLSIPESARPGIYARVRRIVTTEYLAVAIGLSVVLAVVVNLIELMCTAGLPAIYTQILTLQGLPAWQNYTYLALYNVAYMFDDSIMVIVFIITLSHRKMREAEGRWLKLVSGVVVLVLGWAMLFRPEWLQW